MSAAPQGRDVDPPAGGTGARNYSDVKNQARDQIYHGKVHYGHVYNQQVYTIGEAEQHRHGSTARAPGPPSGVPLDPHGIFGGKEIPEVRRARLLKSLSFAQIDARQATIKSAHTKTCDWLFSRAEFEQWLRIDGSPTNNILWLKGKPGSGKSTIMKHAFKYIKAKLGESCTIGFFFNARGSELEKTTIGMFRSLLHQFLSDRPELQYILDGYEIPSDESGNLIWMLPTIEAIFKDTLTKTISSVSFFVDALDECSENEIRDMISFFENVLAMDKSAVVRICFSSRHYPHISIRNGQQMILEDQIEHQQDVTRYIDLELRIETKTLFEEVKAAMLKKFSGVFLWVVLVVRLIQQEYDHGNEEALMTKLNDIPAKFEELLDSILGRDEGDLRDFFICMRWVLYARRPLSLMELYAAVRWDCGTATTFDITKVSHAAVARFVLHISKGLVEQTESTTQISPNSDEEGKPGYMQFIHETVREYFVHDKFLARHDLGIRLASQRNAHDSLRRVCWSQLEIFAQTSCDTVGKTPTQITGSQTDISLLRRGFPEYSALMIYAEESVLHHSDQAESFGQSQSDFIAGLSLPTLRIANCVVHNKPSFSECDTALLLFMNRRHLHLIRRALSLRDIPSVLDHLADNLKGAGDTIEGMMKAHALLLLLREAQSILGRSSSNSLSGLPETHIRLAIDAVSDANGVLEKSSYKEALFILALLLISGKFDINALGENDATPLMLTIRAGLSILYDVLIAQPDIDVNVQTSKGMTALHNAVLARETRGCGALLSVDAVDHTTMNQAGYTPLLLALDRCNMDFARMLDLRGYVDVRDLHGYARFEAAVLLDRRGLLQHDLEECHLPRRWRRDLYDTAVRYSSRDIAEVLLHHPCVDDSETSDEHFRVFSSTGSDWDNVVVRCDHYSSCTHSVDHSPVETDQIQPGEAHPSEWMTSRLYFYHHYANQFADHPDVKELKFRGHRSRSSAEGKMSHEEYDHCRGLIVASIGQAAASPKWAIHPTPLSYPSSGGQYFSQQSGPVIVPKSRFRSTSKDHRGLRAELEIQIPSQNDPKHS